MKDAIADGFSSMLAALRLFEILVTTLIFSALT
ncbi:MAG: hypothetical protein JWP92_2474 [Caulobacter sp.]|nr:hypothetical protein [Caulobacter sp.]